MRAALYYLSQSRVNVSSLFRVRAAELVLIVCFFAEVTLGYSQVSHCGGLTAIVELPSPIFPAIARAAHVEGIVISMVTLSLDGTVASIKTVNGPAMLVDPTMAALRQMKVNPYSGPRDCPFVVTYRIASKNEKPDSLPKSTEIQHIIVTAFNVEIGIRHR